MRWPGHVTEKPVIAAGGDRDLSNDSGDSSCRTRISYRDALRSPREVSEDLPDIAEAEVDDAYLPLEVEGMANVCTAALLAASGALRGAMGNTCMMYPPARRAHGAERPERCARLREVTSTNRSNPLGSVASIRSSRWVAALAITTLVTWRAAAAPGNYHRSSTSGSPEARQGSTFCTA
jgi:hypothetical protein